jgi:hypothetical protein
MVVVIHLRGGGTKAPHMPLLPKFSLWSSDTMPAEAMSCLVMTAAPLFVESTTGRRLLPESLEAMPEKIDTLQGEDNA